MSAAIELAKQALAKAENEEKYTSELLAEVQEKVVGTVRMYIFQRKMETCILLVHYVSAKKSKYLSPTDGKGYVSCKINKVRTLLYKKGSSSLTIETGVEDDFNDSFNILQAPEVDLQMFKKLMKGGSALVTLFLERMKESCKKNIPQPYEEKPPVQIALDFPHILLEYGAVSVLGESPYTLPGGQYLITPESLKFAQDKLNKEKEDLVQMFLYSEACDRGYLSSRNEMLEKLSDLLMAFEEKD